MSQRPTDADVVTAVEVFVPMSDSKCLACFEGETLDITCQRLVVDLLAKYRHRAINNIKIA
jgi:hypothetical protein